MCLISLGNLAVCLGRLSRSTDTPGRSLSSKFGRDMDSLRMRGQLQRQLSFMGRSAELFDAGQRDEGIRIATCLRILFHDRARDNSSQGSVYKLLGRPCVRLLTTCAPDPIPPGTFMLDGYMHVPQPLAWHLYLRRAVPIPVADWWTQVIFIVDGFSIRRCDLVLWAAEKDGGAHSDLNLHPGYVAVTRMWTVSHEVGGAFSEPVEVPDQHLFALRRFALEVLATSEFLRLADDQA